jgi:hypothetical protein
MNYDGTPHDDKQIYNAKESLTKLVITRKKGKSKPIETQNGIHAGIQLAQLDHPSTKFYNKVSGDLDPID